MTIKEKAQKFALGQYLTEYNTEATFEEILVTIKEGDYDKFKVWDTFENYNREFLVDLIEMMVEELEMTFNENNK